MANPPDTSRGPQRPKALVCSCEGTMPLDISAISKACPSMSIQGARHLCRTELDRFRGAAAAEGRLVVACTQEAPLFTEIAEDENLASQLTFVNIRETAGWSTEAHAATPKIAALLSRGQQQQPFHKFVTMESHGTTLILGRDERSIELAATLSDTLDITVLLTGETEVTPPRTASFPIRRGIARTAKGHLGAFELTIDGYAEPAASSRASFAFGAPRSGLTSRADIIIDVTGRAPLFTAHDLRDGYLHANPADAAAVAAIGRKAAGLVGTFDKPRYVAFTESLCAHSRSRITGCTRCLDLCPAGAITPAHDHVAIDPYICGGCGACSAACPTGAVSYAFPTTERLLAEVRTLITTYRNASGGKAPVLLLHDDDHGTAIIDAAARFSDGLPANVIPLLVNEVSEIGLETIAAAFAYGASHVCLLLRQKPRHDPAGIHQTIALAEPILAALGYGIGAASTIESDDPDALIETLRSLPPTTPAASPATFAALGGKRDILKLVLRELHRVAPAKVEAVPLAERAPFGKVNVRTDGCTLCLSCVSACPTSALTAGDDRPLLRFDESLCVQCGLCRATCPEKVMSLEPRLAFTAWDAGPVMIKEEEPFCCIKCGKAFGVKSTIDRILSRLQGKHWMYTGDNANRLDLVKMCEDCRVVTVTNAGIDPYSGPTRPPAKTSDDYFAERERQRAARDAAPDPAPQSDKKPS